MKLYNTLTRQIEPLKPLKPGHITLYTCGPTVYHYYHIGNLRNAVFNDTLKRVLLSAGFKVDHIMNVTDVGHLSSDGDEGNDKLQSRAAEEGKSVWEVAEFYYDAFKKDMKRLNIIPPVEYVRATDRIEQQINMVKVLLDKGYAYQATQAIYFDVSKLSDYGKLTGQRLDQKDVGARDDVVTDPEKRNPQDFALWFFTVGHFKDHQMRWPTPWGEGFPGWHLECSAIIESEFGPTIDIHTGGVDHIGTHHTNEIAQSEAAHDGAPLANHWTHIEFLLVDGAKMSKSLRNTYTLADLAERGFDPLALRLLYLQSHYRTQQNFTWKALEAAGNLLQRLRGWSDLQHQEHPHINPADLSTYRDRIQAALEDDLNTPEALKVFLEAVSATENQGAHTAGVRDLAKYIDEVFGLMLADRPNITSEQTAIIAEREGARKARDFAAADHARDLLIQQGIEINDTSNGPIWRRINA
jgi:cysteinyl-tRNA synthetase